MKSVYVKKAIFVHRTAALVLIAGLLTACGSQAANTPASAPTRGRGSHHGSAGESSTFD